MMDDFPEIGTDELVHWLQAKYRRHGEIEDGVAAERLKSLTTKVERLSGSLKWWKRRAKKFQSKRNKAAK